MATIPETVAQVTVVERLTNDAESQQGGDFVQESAAYPPEFGRLPFKTLIEKLCIKTRTTVRGSEATLVPTSYKKLTWERLEAKQRKGVMDAWNTLDMAEKNRTAN